jgi:integrase
LEANQHPKVVQELLGHANISMTLDTYSHVLPNVKREAINTLDKLFDKEDDCK